MNRKLAMLAIASTFLASCALSKGTGLTDCHDAHGFVSDTVWISGSVRRPIKVAKTIEQHAHQFDHCKNFSDVRGTTSEQRPGVRLIIREVPQEITVEVMVQSNGTPIEGGGRTEYESPMETCYRETMEMIGFPACTGPNYYTVMWFPDRDQKTPAP